MKKIFYSLLSLILVAGIVIGGLELWGTGSVKPSNWNHTHIDADGDGYCDVDGAKMTKPDQTADSDNMVMPEITEGRGIRLYSAVNTLTDDTMSYTLTATITPENATNKKMAWSIAWQNRSSEWANGKAVTNYVTVTPTADGALTATVKCLQAFGEKIEVTVATTDGSDLTATCVCDYVKRIEKIDLKYEASEMPGDVGFDTAVNYSPYNNTIKLYPDAASTNKNKLTTTITYGVGTLEIAPTNYFIRFRVEEAFFTRMQAKGYYQNYHGGFGLDPRGREYGQGPTNSTPADYFANNKEYLKVLFGEEFYTNTELRNAVVECVKKAGYNEFQFVITAQVKLADSFSLNPGYLIDSYSETYYVKPDTSTLGVKASDVGFDENNLPF